MISVLAVLPVSCRKVRKQQDLSWEKWQAHISSAKRGQDKSFSANHESSEALGKDDFPCTIERRGADTLTESEFFSEYHLQKPVLLSDAAAAWKKPAFAWQTLLDRYGLHSMLSGKSLSIQQNGGSGHNKVKLGDYVRTMDNPVQRTVEGIDTQEQIVEMEPLYIYDPVVITQLPQLRKAMSLPSAFSASDTEVTLAIGGRNSGVQWRRGLDGWNVQLHGHTRWFMSEPHRVPLPSYPPFTTSMLDYVRALYPKVAEDERPVECVQRPGELLYVPEGWYRSTLNLDATLALVGQNRTTIMTEPMRLYMTIQKNQEKPEENLKTLDRLAVVAPNTNWLHFERGNQLWSMGKHEMAYDSWEESIDENPAHASSRQAIGVYKLMQLVNTAQQNTKAGKPDKKLRKMNEAKLRMIEDLSEAFRLDPTCFICADSIRVIFNFTTNTVQADAWVQKRDAAIAAQGLRKDDEMVKSVIW
jgi:hypothetical protein